MNSLSQWLAVHLAVKAASSGWTTAEIVTVIVAVCGAIAAIFGGSKAARAAGRAGVHAMQARVHAQESRDVLAKLWHPEAKVVTDDPAPAPAPEAGEDAGGVSPG